MIRGGRMEWLRDLRKQYNLTQAGLAKAVGVAQPTINAWELGQRTPKPKEVLRLSKFFEREIYMVVTPDSEKDELTWTLS